MVVEFIQCFVYLLITIPSPASKFMSCCYPLHPMAFPKTCQKIPLVPGEMVVKIIHNFLRSENHYTFELAMVRCISECLGQSGIWIGLNGEL